MLAQILGNRAYLERTSRCGSLFVPVYNPPPPPPPPPEPEPEPEPRLMTRWVWPPPARQLIIPQSEDKPAPFTTEATPMVGWLASHPTEIWPRLKTMWDTHAREMEAVG